MADPNAGYGFGYSTSADPTQDRSPLYPNHPLSVAKTLISTANYIVNPRGKGIYATDETPEGIEARLRTAEGANPGEYSEDQKRERRMKWRADLYDTMPSDYISAVILHSETLIDFQLAPVLSNRGIIPGVRADTDSHPLPSSPSEPATQGLDDLLPRLLAARGAGARFTKWRAPILINASGTLPSHNALETQATSLARFAAISQHAGLVPIVEPDVDFTQSDASLSRSVEVHVKIISLIFAKCAEQGVLIEGTLIKPSFPQPGVHHPSHGTTSAEEIAEATAAVLVRSLPLGVAGVVFLSGGLEDVKATAYLNAVNVLKNNAVSAQEHAAGQISAVTRLPPLTFSFGRGLQGDAMARWAKGDVEGAREAFRKRAKGCYLSSRGELKQVHRSTKLLSFSE